MGCNDKHKISLMALVLWITMFINLRWVTLTANPKAHNVCQPQMNEFDSDEFKNLPAGPAGQEGNNTIVKLIQPHPTTIIKESDWLLPIYALFLKSGQLFSPFWLSVFLNFIISGPASQKGKNTIGKSPLVPHFKYNWNCTKERNNSLCS